jgi:sigma-E factor negative regulatory protein RseA
MSDRHVREKESLSALMDGEAEELEFHRTLKRTAESDELRDTWRRYQLAAAAMRRDLPHQVIDYSASIRLALEDEPALGRNAALSRMMKPLGRFAIAASVAAVAIVGVQQYSQPNGISAPVASVDDVQMNFDTPQLRTAADFGIPAVAARTVSASSEPESYRAPQPVIVVKEMAPDEVTREQVQAYLNELMSRHTEHAAFNTNQGMLPFARMPASQDY